MKNKKALILTDALIYILIGLFVFLVLVFVIPKLLGGGVSETKSFIKSTKDFDTDGVSDIFDKCVCDYGDDDGCPAGELEAANTPEKRQALKYGKCDGQKAPTYEKKK